MGLEGLAVTSSSSVMSSVAAGRSCLLLLQYFQQKSERRHQSRVRLREEVLGRLRKEKKTVKSLVIII